MASPSKKTFFLCCSFVRECGNTVMVMPQHTCMKIIPISISTQTYVKDLSLCKLSRQSLISFAVNWSKDF
jgi:hypothetical protein